MTLQPSAFLFLRSLSIITLPSPAMTVRLRRGRTAALMFAITFLLTTTSQAQSGEWAWMSGANTSFGQGVYGTLGVSSPSNVPGARSESTSLTDSSGNLWLFGGSGAASLTNSSIHFNDLWEFSPSTNQWTWISGFDNTVGGVYGTLGVPATGNVPGARENAMGWADGSGNLWLFGGWGYDSSQTFGSLNDLWKFNPATKQWTWMSGSSTLPNANDSCQPGVYGTLGVASAGNVPGGRQYAATWTDANGNFWLFGGPGCDSAGTQALLNDLWKFNPSTNQWSWMSGSSKALYTAYGSPGVYGTQGVASAANVPGGRWVSGGWTDSSGNLWLFGGEGYDSIGARGYLNDLWKFNPSTNQWIWISGSSTLGTSNCYQPGDECSQPGVYGTLGQPAAGNVPSGRRGAVGAIDAKDNLWLFGGANSAGGLNNEMNDLWKFNPQTNQWAWMSGSNIETCGLNTSSGNCAINGAHGVYGTLRVPAPGNVPGSRDGEVGWTDKSGNLWLFGGQGFDSSINGSFLPLNDLWEYQLKQNSAVALTSSANPVFAQNPITLTASVTASGATPTGTVTFLDGTTSIGTGTLNSSSSATLSVNNLTIGSHTLTASYAGDANNFAAANAPLTEVVEDFGIAAGATTTATIKSGGSASYTFTFNPIAPATTFPSALTLSASGGPPGSTYTLSPTTIASGAGSTPVTLTVAVPSSSSSMINAPGRLRPPLSLTLALAALLMPLPAGLRKAGRRMRGIDPFRLLLAIGIAATTALSGCSGGSSAVRSQPQTYTITMTGTVGALSHSTVVTLTVN